MKTTLTCLILVIIYSLSHAQPTTKLYTSIENYNNLTSIDTQFVIKQLTDPDATAFGNLYYRIRLIGRNGHKKKPGKNCLLIDRNDSLFINSAVINARNFEPVLFRNSDYIYFRGFMSRLPEHAMEMKTAGAQAIRRSLYNYHGTNGWQTAYYLRNVYGTPQPDADKATKLALQRYNYIIHLNSGQVDVVTISTMQEILDSNPELDKLYMEEGHPEDPDSIIKYLKAISK